MTPSDPSPQLPTWIFIVTDLALIGAAIACGALQPRPFSSGTMIAIVGCLLAGAIVLFYPIVAHYERAKNEALDDRQRALEALSRTLTSSAEQISIAANGLHEVAELAQKNLRQAEHLPQKLHEKIAEFDARLAAANDAEKEELEKELVSLRTSESDRLDSVSDKIFKSTAEWAKLEAATQKNLVASRATIAQAAADAIAQLTAALPAALTAAARSLADLQAASAAKHEDALVAAQSRASAALDEKISALTRSLTAATTDALAKIDTALTAGSARFETTLAIGATRLETAVTAAVKAMPIAPPAPATPAAVETAPTVASAESATETSKPATEAAVTPPAPADAPAHPPKRPRKPRRPEPAPGETPAPLPAASGREIVVPTEEPAPIPAATIPEVAPIDLGTVEPSSKPATTPERLAADQAPAVDDKPAAPSPGSETLTPIVETPAPELATNPEPIAEAPPERPPEPVPDFAEKPTPRQRAAKKSEPAEDDPGLGLEIDENPPAQAAEVAEHVLTSDGATRLIVTAYIGIGNRLFIRGEGPGLSWEKGVPLQFVSIGKWRWETPDATAPVSFKLYKNDTVECTALGSRSIDPAHQQEVMASF